MNNNAAASPLNRTSPRGSSSRIRNGRGDALVLFVMYAILTTAFMTVLYPLVYIVSSSFSSTNAVITGRVWLFPVEPSLMGYQAVFKNKQIVSGFLNSVFYTVAGTSINLVMTILAAYPLSRKDFVGRGALMALFTFTMMFSGGLIPTYMLIRSLKMLNTYWALLIPGAVAVWNMIIARTFFQSNIPDELREAAELDGSSDLRFIWSIVLPLSGPIIAVLILYYAVGHWNSYFDAMIYLTNAKRYPLQVVLRSILVQNQIQENMFSDIDVMTRIQGLADLLKYSLIVVASAPMLIAYPFVQKYFIKGVLVGSIKG